MKNFNEIFDKNANLNKNKPLFWFKQDSDWVSISWSEASNEKKKLIQILKSLKIKKGDKVSIIECRPYSKTKKYEVVGK